MRDMRRIERLPKRPHLKAVSLSSPVAAACPRRFDRSLDNARRWFEISEGNLARGTQGHLVGSAEDRARDLIDAWFDPNVDAIISVIGGMTTAQTLEHLPLRQMAEHPKLVIGYSDTTTLFSALACHGIPAIYGPSLMPQFGEFGGPHPYTVESLLRVLRPEPMGLVPECDEQISEILMWDEQDDRTRRGEKVRTRRSLSEGHGTGWLFVANMGSVLSLAGTKWFPNLDGALLVLEDDEEESPDTIERMLTQLRMLGVFHQIRGLVFGRLPAAVGMDDEHLSAALRRAMGDLPIPVAIGFEVGHVDPFHALPILPRATLSVTRDHVGLTVDQAVVAQG